MSMDQQLHDGEVKGLDLAQVSALTVANDMSE